jgi:threonine synthase
MMLSDIQYYSTNLKSARVSFREALLKGLAPDGGLYTPDQIPSISIEELISFSSKVYDEIAFDIANKFLSREIDENDLRAITKDAYNFDVPLENVYGRKYILRLDQGPTASFKDFAARMMGRLMQHYLKKEDRKLLILTATSGDTGSAIANAFYNLDNIQVVILFPKDEVTDRQRKQMTTLHNNVRIISVNGKFDDCQALVKMAFTDEQLGYLNLSSANSINIGRLIPQSMYYIYAYSRLCDASKGEEIVFSVPSGNFGNLMGGLIALKMGLPVKKFVVCTNENDEVPEYFKSGNYKTIIPSLNCISSAMNVGHPSNMARIVSLYGGIMNEKGIVVKQPDMPAMKNDMFAVSLNDEETRRTINNVYKNYNIILEPHGSVGWTGLRRFFNTDPDFDNEQLVAVSLETAHPAKFPDEIEKILGIDPELPSSLAGLDNKEERFDPLENNYNEFKTFLKKNY